MAFCNAGLCSRSAYNIAVVSASFVLLFASYNTLQNFETSLLPNSWTIASRTVNWNLGNVSLAVLYGSVAITVFTAPWLVRNLGTKGAMVLGAACYVAYEVSLIWLVPWVVLLMSVVIGFGAAILWTALGVFLTQNATKDNYGAVSGAFWSTFQLSQVAGNLAAYLVLPHLAAESSLYIGFAVVAAAGTAGLVALRKPTLGLSAAVVRALEEASRKGGSDGSDAEGLKGWWRRSFGRQQQRLRQASGAPQRKWVQACVAEWSAACHTRSLLLVPLIFFSGMELSFWTGEFPQLLSSDVIGLVLTFAGIGEVIGGYSTGRIADRFGRTSAVVAGAVLYGVGLGIASWMKTASTTLSPVVGGAPLHAYFAALLFGLGDSAFNTCIYSIISLMFDKAPPGAASTTGDAAQPQCRDTVVDVHGAIAVDSSIPGDVVVTSGGGWAAVGATGAGKGAGHRASNAGDASAFVFLSVGGVGGSVNMARRGSSGPDALTESLLAPATTAAGHRDDTPLADDPAVVEARINSVGAFTLFQLVQNIGSAFGFFYALGLPMHGASGTLGQVWVQAALMVAGTAMFAAVDCRFARKPPPPR